MKMKRPTYSAITICGAVLGVMAVGIFALAADAADIDRIRRSATDLVYAYESRDLEKVLKLLSPRYPNPVGLEKALREEYDRYHSIEVLTRIGPIVVGKEAVSARVNWYRKRILRKTGRQEKAEDEVTLYFRMENGAYRLIREEGRGFLPVPREREKAKTPPPRR